MKPPPLVDFHCHLDLFPDPAAAFEDCRRHKILTLSVTTTPRAWSQNKAWGAGNPFVLPAPGLHPELVHSHGRELDELLTLVTSEPVVGEVGLDGSRRYRASYTNQREIFERVVAAATRRHGCVLSIHSRAAAADVLEILAPHMNALRPVLHWFSGTTTQLRAGVGMGCFFSVNGSMIVSESGRKLVAAIPRERLLLETDAPFRAGTATGGGRVRDLETTLDSVAALHGLSASDLRNRIYVNACALLNFTDVDR